MGALGLILVADNACAANAGRLRHASTRSWMNGFAAEPLANDALRANERAFLAKAVETTQQQMRLAEVGASQAESTEVRSHALQLAADYRDLNTALEVLIRRKGGLPGAPVGGTSENFQKLIAKSGGEFDREFVRIASQASSDVMNLFENAAADAKDADVRELAASELPVLRNHRNTIAGLKRTLD